MTCMGQKMAKALHAAWFVFLVVFITFMLWIGLNNEHDKKQCVELGQYPVVLYWKIECAEIREVAK